MSLLRSGLKSQHASFVVSPTRSLHCDTDREDERNRSAGEGAQRSAGSCPCPPPPPSWVLSGTTRSNKNVLLVFADFADSALFELNAGSVVVGSIVLWGMIQKHCLYLVNFEVLNKKWRRVFNILKNQKDRCISFLKWNSWILHAWAFIITTPAT